MLPTILLACLLALQIPSSAPSGALTPPRTRPELIEALGTGGRHVLLVSTPGLPEGWGLNQGLAAPDELDLVRATLPETEPRWALYSPDGECLGSGPGHPDPDQILAFMRTQGWRPLAARLGAHLRQHPQDAWARMDRVILQARVLRQSAADTEARTAALADLAEDFRFLGRVSGWEVVFQPGTTLQTVFLRVPFGEALESLEEVPEARDLRIPLRAALLQALAKDPEAADLWKLALAASPRSREGLAPLRDLFLQTDPVPACRWPSSALVDIAEALLSPQERLEWASQALASLARYGEGSDLGEVSIWGGEALRLQLQLSQPTQALALLAQLRAQAGPQWPSLSGWLRYELMGCLQDSDPVGAEMSRVLETSAPPSAASIPRFRGVRLGTGEALAWSRLQQDPALAAWAPSELNWTPLRPTEMHLFQTSLPAGGWALLQGTRIVAQGPHRPSAQDLDGHLRALAQPRLDQLTTFLAMHPERRDARRDRIAWLSRWANPPAFLVEDLAANLEPPPLTGTALETARRTCTRLQELLTHWPAQERLWISYAGWYGRVPGCASPAELLAHLEPWPGRPPLRTPGPLSLGTLEAVAQRLEAAGRWGDLCAWLAHRPPRERIPASPLEARALWDALAARERKARLALERDIPASR